MPRFKPSEIRPPGLAGEVKKGGGGAEGRTDPAEQRPQEAPGGAGPAEVAAKKRIEAAAAAEAAIEEARKAAEARRRMEATPQGGPGTLTEAGAALEQKRVADEFLLNRWQTATEAQREAIKVAFPDWRPEAAQPSPEAAAQPKAQPEAAGAEVLNAPALAASILETPLRGDSAQIGGWVDRVTQSLGAIREPDDALFAITYTNVDRLLKEEKVEAGVSTQVREGRREVKVLERSQAVVEQAGANRHIQKLYDAFTRHGIGLDADRAVRLAIMCVTSTNQEGNPVAWGVSRDAELPGLEVIYSLRALDHEQATLNKAKETLHHKPSDIVAQRTAGVAEKRFSESVLDFSNTATELVQKVLTGEINLDESSTLPARETDVIAILEARKKYATETTERAKEMTRQSDLARSSGGRKQLRRELQRGELTRAA